MKEEGLFTPPAFHYTWTCYLQTTAADSYPMIHLMLWTHKDINAYQIPIPSPDIIAVTFSIDSQTFLVLSVYIPGKKTTIDEALTLCL